MAVDGIDFRVEPGEAFGFLGPNGAGKTSTMRMIGCVSQPTSGELRILGMDPAVDGPRIRARLGVVPQDDSLDSELTVLDNLTIYGRYFDLPHAEIRRRVEELLEFMQLSDRRDDLVDPLSGGMKRRLTIGRALINQPDLLLLDEPTTGLDPQARHLLVGALLPTEARGRHHGAHDALHGRGGAALRPARDHGRRPHRHRGLAARTGGAATRRATSSSCGSRRRRSAMPRCPRLSQFGERVEALTDRVLVYTHDGDKIVDLVGEDGLHPESVYARRGTLEDVFLILTGRTLED